jgi:hypothetical protein
LGTVPAWVAAIGTAGALIASVVLLFRARRERREDVEDRLKDQARHVSAWLPLTGEPGVGFGPVVVVNNSDEPSTTSRLAGCGTATTFHRSSSRRLSLPPRSEVEAKPPPSSARSEIPPLHLEFTVATRGPLDPLAGDRRQAEIQQRRSDLGESSFGT